MTNENDNQKPKYEITPEAATSFEVSDISQSSSFDRKKVLVTLSVVFAIIICGGLIFNANKKKDAADESENNRAANVPKEFLQNELDRTKGGTVSATGIEEDAAILADPAAEKLPEAVEVRSYQGQGSAQNAVLQPAQGNYPPASSGGGGSYPSDIAHNAANYSSMTPNVEGSLFGSRVQNSGAPQSGGTYAEQYPYAQVPQGGQIAQTTAQNPYASPYASLAQSLPQGAYPAQNDMWTTQNMQSNKQGFSSSSNGGSVSSGYYLGEDSIWLGSIVQAVLETAINTDLPGNVIARVTHNVFDSLTGKKLLIPQGTLLVAKYNSSVSYAQSRVQIVWDTLVRPDGFYVELEGMPAVDKAGMSGQEAQKKGNWFEYVKAAGIISMFSIANSKMAEEAGKYSSTGVQEGIVNGNAEFLNQVGSNIVSQAMNIQPTLIVTNGTAINIMLNKTIYLPAVGANKN
ncbi:MAG: hypothetical protein Ta2A_07750 [Treponemataceae bacterium]|nr:MAG: hypothetical protein Ta2A_07750 [Treponemataceae bacterium]